jgi:hypothetical protein
LKYDDLPIIGTHRMSCETCDTLGERCSEVRVDVGTGSVYVLQLSGIHHEHVEIGDGTHRSSSWFAGQE